MRTEQPQEPEALQDTEPEVILLPVVAAGIGGQLYDTTESVYCETQAGPEGWPLTHYFAMPTEDGLAQQLLQREPGLLGLRVPLAQDLRGERTQDVVEVALHVVTDNVAVRLAADEPQIAVEVSYLLLQPVLCRLVFAQDLNGDGREGDAAAPARRLRFLERRAGRRVLYASPDVQQASVEVNILPVQAEHLALAKPAQQRQGDRHMKAVRLAEIQKQPDLLRREDRHLRPARPGWLYRLRRVHGQEAQLDGVLQGLPQNPVVVPDRACGERLVVPLSWLRLCVGVVALHVGRRQLREGDVPEGRHEVDLHDDAVPLVRLSGEPGPHVCEPALQVFPHRQLGGRGERIRVQLVKQPDPLPFRVSPRAHDTVPLARAPAVRPLAQIEDDIPLLALPSGSVAGRANAASHACVFPSFFLRYFSGLLR